MKSQIAGLELRRALRHAVPPSCDRSYQPGDKALVWREKQIKNRIDEWLGPFEVEGVDYQRKLVFFRDQTHNPDRLFNVAQVKPYLAPERLAHSFNMDLDSG